MADERGRAVEPLGPAIGASAGQPPIDRRRLLKGAGAGSLLLSTAGVVGACGDVAAAGGGLQLAQNQPGAPPPPPGSLPSVPSLRDSFGATAAGADDDTLAFAAVPPGTGVLLTPGVYRVASDVTIRYHMWVMPGAVIRPDRGATVSWAPGCSITAGDYQIFDDSAGGAFGGGANTVGWARSSWFPGETRGERDLGKQINNAFAWGFLQVDVPPAPDHVIRTTVRILHGATVRCMWHGYPRHAVCATDDKPVFEALGSIRHWRIIGGVFDGAATDTPSCFLLCGRPETPAAAQCGDTTALSEVNVSGNWGIGIVVSISAEVIVFSNCNMWIQGRGDTSWSGPFATVVIGNADFWGVPYAYTRPTPVFASCSAIVFQNCDIRGGFNDEGSVFLLKGQVEDLTIVASYLNAVGRCHILCEPGSVGGAWTSPRRVYVGGGGRTETNKGLRWRGVPTVIVDGMDRGGALYLLTFGEMGHFVGAEDNSTPIIKTERGGVLYAFTMHQGGHVEHTDTLIEHQGADLMWADVRCHFKVDIDCGGRWLHDCDIKIGGKVIGDLGPGSKVRAANVSNW